MQASRRDGNDDVRYSKLEKEFIMADSIDCGKCGQKVDGAWKFCPMCGNKTERLCSKCGMKMEEAWVFCPKCGTSVTDSTAIAAPEPPAPAEAAVPENHIAAGKPDTLWYTDNPGAESFTISNADELAGLAKLVNDGERFKGKTVNLAGDIDLMAYYNWEPIGNYTKPFSGIFDGSGHAIRNLTINSPNKSWQGLFGHICSGTVKNLSLCDIYIDGDTIIGGVVGRAKDSTLNSCSSNGTICGEDNVGGIVGLITDNDSVVYNCHSTASIIDKRNIKKWEQEERERQRRKEESAGTSASTSSSSSSTSSSDSGSDSSYKSWGEMLGEAEWEAEYGVEATRAREEKISAEVERLSIERAAMNRLDRGY